MLRASFRQSGWQSGPLIADRAQEFGDGLFETMRLTPELEAPLWRLHKERLCKGLAQLDFPIDSLSQVEQAFHQIESIDDVSLLAEHARLNDLHIQAKLLVSRQANHEVSSEPSDWPRGYLFSNKQKANIQIQLTLAPGWNYWKSGWNLGVSPVILSSQPLLAGAKHLNRLEQVLARRAFQPTWQESLMLNQAGDVIEACMSNIFVIEQDVLVTPVLDHCGVDGVARRWLLEHSQQAGLSCKQGMIDLTRIKAADGLLLCNTLNGFSWAKCIADFSFDEQKQVRSKEIQQKIQTMFINAFTSGTAQDEN